MSEYVMSGAEMASMLKGQLNSNMKFNGVIGKDDPSLHLSEADIKWWRDAKIGFFVHWGIYSLLGRGEWVYINEKIPEEEYRRLAEEFHPSRSAEEIMKEWVDTAQEAGMKYAVMVTRHHDGFALWDSKCSWKDFTSQKCGPQTDYVKAFTDACHKKGIHTGLYYSPMDWRFPGYFDPKGQGENAAIMKRQAYGQLEELCSNYGKIEILWYDGGWLAHQGTDADAAWFWEPIKMNKMIRQYNPTTMVTPRSGYRGDFECDEGPHEVKGAIVPIPWEKNMSLSSVWGYRPNETFHDLKFIIRMLVNVVCRDGNLLLNVGPDPEGYIPEDAKKILKGLGKWLKENGEAIYGTRGGIWQPVDQVYGCTYKDNIIYLHILNCKEFEKCVLPYREQKHIEEKEAGVNVIETDYRKSFYIEDARMLSGEKVTYDFTKAGIKLYIPNSVQKENRIDTIVKLQLRQ